MEAKENQIIFNVNNGNTEILRLEPNGDIYVKGKLVENDKEVVEGLREFLREAMKNKEEK